MSTDPVECVLKADAIVGELPVWCGRERVLYWVDITGQRIHRFHPASGVNDTFHLPDPVTCVALRERGGLLATLRKDFAFFDPGTESLRVLDRVEEDQPDNRDFWLQTEDLPKPDNRVTLDDKGGIVLDLNDTNLESHQRLIAKLQGMLKEVSCHEHLLPRSLYLNHKIPIGGTAHQNGTVHFGRDPKTSALDLNCKAHDLDNLYVVDGSFFVSCGSVNPALTIIANALRVGDHLLERLGRARP